MKTPAFWNKPNSPLSLLLSPIGRLYMATTARRLRRTHPYRASIPVICVGNLTAGGTGKTPIVRDLATRLASKGRQPHILSRGYGGREHGPLKIDPSLHSAADIGDEPLLIAQDAPCWVAVDRAAGAKAIAAEGADVIIMDDGYQNPSLHQDLRLIVVDGETGFGNGRGIPAGPLRENIRAGIARADALIVMGEDPNDHIRSLAGKTLILNAGVETSPLDGARLVAFAGIGRPGKFRITLGNAGATVVGFHEFGDHHAYSETELEHLAVEAARQDADLVTTEKDWIRLSQPWRARIKAIPIRIRWRDEAALIALLDLTACHG
jgi:tetraacyldisaccharide 4'-kinase